MKTKNMLVAVLCVVMAMGATAQEQAQNRHANITTRGDSIIIMKGDGDMRIKIYENRDGNPENSMTEIYEGVYLEKVDADRRTFLDALPFIPQKKRRNSYEPHVSGVFIGFSRMTGGFMSFGNSNRFPLDLSQSWEFGFNLLATCHNFKKNPHWGFNTGLTWGYRSFNIDGSHALMKRDGRAVFVPSDGETNYGQSRLRHFYFRIPLLVEWQQRLSYGKRLFFNLGPEFEVRHGVKSFTHINGGKKQRVGRGLYVNPVGINMLAQAGYGNLGLYLRYSTYRFFQKDKGPDVMPCTFGIAWYW